MSSRTVAGAPLDFASLRSELEVPGDFSSAALADAQTAAAAPVASRDDATDIEFLTIDPPGSRDLDQAVHLSRDGSGYVVQYAIADVAHFVQPGSPLDAQTHARGQTFYFPDRRVPLHPPVLGEAAASLLPGVDRLAVVWRIALDQHGAVRDVQVRRASVRSRRQCTYDEVQQAIDSHAAAPETFTLLAEIGTLRLHLARARHAIDLALPEQQVHPDGPGGWQLTFRAPLDAERYNAEISLLTGMCAAKLMLDAGVGILRTLPMPDHATIEQLRRAARALGVTWPNGAAPGDVLATLDRANPKHVALLEHATSLLRGAGYTTFTAQRPSHTEHAGIGAPYAHVTAPLRRLVDRFGSEICLAVSAGTPVPDWVLAAMAGLPEEMQASDHLAHTVERAVVDMTEAWLLRDRVGDTFTATVIDADAHSGTIAMDPPAVRARCDGADLPIGEPIEVRLVAADVHTRQLRFVRA